MIDLHGSTECFVSFLKTFDADAMVKHRAAINDLEQRKIDPELLKIKIKLAKILKILLLTILAKRMDAAWCKS
jgi:hypothetical protein